MAIHGLGRGVSFLPNALSVSRTPAPDTHGYVGISLDVGALLSAYAYEDGTVGALIAQKAVSFAGTVNRSCLIGYAPLAVLFDCDGDLHVWNVTLNTVYTVADPCTSDGTTFSYGGNGYAYLADFDNITGKAHLYRIDGSGNVQDIGGSPDTLTSPPDGDTVTFLQWDGSNAYLAVQDSGSIGAPNGDSGAVIMAPGAQPVFTHSSDFLFGDPAVWGNNVLEGHRYIGRSVTVQRPSGGEDSLIATASSLPAFGLDSILVDAFIPSGFYLQSWFPSPGATGICLFRSISGQRQVGFCVPGLLPPVTFHAVDDMPGGIGAPSFMVAV